MDVPRRHAMGFVGGGAATAAKRRTGAPLRCAQISEDWREFRAKMVLQGRGLEYEPGRPWCHAVPQAERGGILLANPEYFLSGRNQEYFRNAVILLIECDENGAHGIILNKRLKVTIHDIWPINSSLSDNRLYFGGDVGESSYFFLHNYQGMRQSQKLMDGVYCGGYEDVVFAAEQGKVKPENVRVYNRYCGWAPKQLGEEIDRRVWFPAACSKELIFDEHVDVDDAEAYWTRVRALLDSGHVNETT